MFFFSTFVSSILFKLYSNLDHTTKLASDLFSLVSIISFSDTIRKRFSHKFNNFEFINIDFDIKNSKIYGVTKSNENRLNVREYIVEINKNIIGKDIHTFCQGENLWYFSVDKTFRRYVGSNGIVEFTVEMSCQYVNYCLIRRHHNRCIWYLTN